jgi:hypothetical protein
MSRLLLPLPMKLACLYSLWISQRCTLGLSYQNFGCTDS